MLLPSAIFFINPEISTAQQELLKTQLFIDEVMQDSEFDDRVTADPNYPTVVHGQNLRILVIKNNFADVTNRELADVVIFIKQGLMSIEKNKFGPPDVTFSINRPNLWALLRAVNSDQVPILPSKPVYPFAWQCQVPCPPCGLGGIFALQLQNSGISACKNPDNEYNNIAFINRK